jgi:type IX secretion system PorP/SprF family membrane protein
MKYKRVIVAIAFLFISLRVHAQQAVQYSQYMYTPSLINPAYVGLSGELQVSLLHKSQWVGVSGAPTSQTLLISSPLTSGLGIGFGVTRDQIGPANETNTSIDFSYFLKLNSKGLKLSFGMKGALQLLNVDFSRLLTQNPNDNSLNNITTRYTPGVGAGLFLYNNVGYLGLSIPNLLTTQHIGNATASAVNSVQQTYLMGGMNFDISDNVAFKPSFLVKSVKNAPVTVDMSLNFLFNNRIATGISYRIDAAVSALMQVKVSKAISVGYAYDLDTSGVSYFSGGSHEVILIFRWNKLVDTAQKLSWIY